MKNEIIKNKIVYEFMNQWFTDAMTCIETNPAQYSVHTGMYPTNSGFCPTTTITDERTGDYAYAICSNGDAYDFRLGIAIAWAKLNRVPLPHELKPKHEKNLRKVKPGHYYYDDGERYKVISKTTHFSNGSNNIIITVYSEVYHNYDVLTLKEYEKYMVVVD